jgi:hypothetical protein
MLMGTAQDAHLLAVDDNDDNVGHHIIFIWSFIMGRHTISRHGRVHLRGRYYAFRQSDHVMTSV